MRILFRFYKFSLSFNKAIGLGVLFLLNACNIKPEQVANQYFIPSLANIDPTNTATKKNDNGSAGTSSVVGTTPVIGNLTNYIFPLTSSTTAVKAGSTLTLNPTYSDPNGDLINPGSWTCTYRTIGLDASDGNYILADTNCDLLPSITTINSVRKNGTLADDNTTAKFDVSTGQFIWTPTTTSSGTYRFTFKVTDLSGEQGTTVIYVTAMPDFETSTSLSLYLDPNFSLGITPYGYAPRIDSTADDGLLSWPDLSGRGLASSGDLSNFISGAPWAGTGSSSSVDPYRLLFAGADYFTLGTGLNSATKFSVSTWIRPTSITTGGATILANSDGASSGFILKQSTKSPQTLELSIGNYAGSYSATVLADSPIAYWRMNDTPFSNGSTIADTSGAGTCAGPCNGTLTDFLGTPVTTAASGLVNEANTAIKLFWGDYVTTPYIFNPSNTNWTSEIWLKADFNTTNFYYSALALTAGTGGQSEFLLAENTNGWALYSQFGGVKQFVGIAPKADVWYHIVQTYNHTTDVYTFYVNGVQTSTGTMTPYNNTDGSFVIGTVSLLHSSPVWQGPIHDVALYGTELTAAQIQRHYYAGAGCRGSTKIDNSTWNHVGINFDGTTATLMLNGQIECYGNPGLSSSGSAENLTLGRRPISNNNYWSGQLGPVLISSSSDGTPTTSTANLFKDFYRTFDIFNPLNKMSDIVRSNLILHWDASLAKNGAAPYTNTCSENTTQWLDLSGNNNNGTSTNFSTAAGCNATHGWNGAGTSANPYKVDLTGQAHLFYIDKLRSTNKTYTFDFWFKNANGNDWQWLFDSPNLTLYLSDLTNAQGFIGYRDTTYTATAGDNKNITAAFTDGVWHHLVFVLDSTAGTGTVYIDGTSMGSGAYTGRDLVGNMGFFGRRANNSWGFYDAEVSIVRLYERAFTAAEVKQNCHAQVSRFSGASCAAP